MSRNIISTLILVALGCQSPAAVRPRLPNSDARSRSSNAAFVHHYAEDELPLEQKASGDSASSLAAGAGPRRDKTVMTSTDVQPAQLAPSSYGPNSPRTAQCTAPCCMK